MATNTAALKTFAQQTRIKLRSLIATKMEYILTQDTAELRGFELQIQKLKNEITAKGRDLVVEEVAYTWFNRVMALRFMDANEYTSSRVVTPGAGQMRPEILQDAMAGIVDEDLHLRPEDLSLPEAKLYRKLLVASCNAYGASMPFLFEHISDYTELLLPDDLLSEQSFVTDIRRGMTDEDCQNVEVMGWLYQFYITDRKADAETKKSRKGGLKSDEQAAATQLFTPHWVVRYMVENSLGRIWMTLHPESRLVDEMPYYIPTPEGQTDTIPEDIHSVRDIRLLDPCVGSGHIAVYAFDLFTKMYEEEGYQTREIPAEILTHNIYGIDIDRRCYQLACFALTMKARAYHSRYLRRPVQPNVMALQTIDHNTIASTGAWSSKSILWQMEHVDTIGSLLQISPEECTAIQVEEGLFGEKQQVLKTQAEYLSGKYHCVVTNPPYLGKGMGDAMRTYIKKVYPDSWKDTMAAFMERCLKLSCKNGKMAIINQQSWMFISSYENLRKSLVDNYHIDSLLQLGTHTFDEIGGEIVRNATFVFANHKPFASGIYFDLSDGGNSAEKEQLFLNRKNCYKNISQNKFELIPGYPIAFWVNDSIINLFKSSPITKYSTPRKGNSTSDNPRFLRFWTEVNYAKVALNYKCVDQLLKDGKRWVPYNKGGGSRKWYGYNENLVDWKDNAKEIREIPTSVITNEKYYMQPGLTWSTITTKSFGVRYFNNGFIFDNGGCCLFDLNESRNYLAGLLNSKVLPYIMSSISQTQNFQSGEIAKMPVVYQSNDTIEIKTYNCFELSKQDWDAHETSWDFQTNELLIINEANCIDILNDYASATGICIDPAAPAPESLEWRMDLYKMKWAAKFLQLHKNEEELNRQFIDIYGLQDELTPDVPLNEITILQKGEIDIKDGEIVWNDAVLIKQFISYLVGCFMGRYSVDRPGLIIASQHQDLNALGLKVEGIDNGTEGRLLIDNDGIVPILEGEYFSDDMTVRIEGAIKTLFGEANFQQNLKYLEQTLGKSLRDYLFKDFFADHAALYAVKSGGGLQKRPVYWLFSSKMGDRRKKGYFKALVYMHRIESDTLSKLHADYVAPYIDKIEQQKLEAEDQAVRDDLTQAQRNKAAKQAAEYAAALREVREFATILAQMSTQRLTIDLDDGVRVNYPKYYPLVEPIKGLDKSEE